MAEHFQKTQNLPTGRDAVDPGMIRRPIRSTWQEQRPDPPTPAV